MTSIAIASLIILLALSGIGMASSGMRHINHDRRAIGIVMLGAGLTMWGFGMYGAISMLVILMTT
jgi:hypothetical protein